MSFLVTPAVDVRLGVGPHLCERHGIGSLAVVLNSAAVDCVHGWIEQQMVPVAPWPI